VKAAAGVIGVKAFVKLRGNADPDARSMEARFNRAGQAMTRMRNTLGASWTALTQEFVFETIPGVAEYRLPDGFQSIIDGTVWDRSTYREMRGTLSPQQWQEVKSGLIESVRIAPFYRIRRSAAAGRTLWLDPTPAGRDEIVLEFQSAHWVESADRSTYRYAIESDTDKTVFDDDLLEMSVLWRFKQSRGLTFAVELAEYEQEVMRRFAEDAGARAIRVGRSAGNRRGLNVPETGFGGLTAV